MAGIIGGNTNKTAMETAGISFGNKGNMFFAALNVLQLLGWTAVMIISSAKAIDIITQSYMGVSANALWCILIAVFIFIWILSGLKKLQKINIFAIGGLFILTIVLSVIVFKSGKCSISYTRRRDKLRLRSRACRCNAAVMDSFNIGLH